MEHETERGDAIVLEGMLVPAALGVTAAERRMRRPVHIDVEIGLCLRAAGESDRIRDTLDYGMVYDLVEEIAGTREHKLVEALAERIAAALLERFEIDWVSVRVRKLRPVAGALELAGVRIVRRR
jgi:dihydroneopterin aldolase